MAACAEEPVLCCLLTTVPPLGLCTAGVFRYALLNLRRMFSTMVGRNERRTYNKNTKQRAMYKGDLKHKNET